MNDVQKAELPRKLAAYAHESWSTWMKHLFLKCIFQGDGSIVIPQKVAARWTRQMNTAFDALPVEEQKSEFAEAEKIMKILAEMEQEDSRFNKVLEDITAVRKG